MFKSDPSNDDRSAILDSIIPTLGRPARAAGHPSTSRRGRIGRAMILGLIGGLLAGFARVVTGAPTLPERLWLDDGDGIREFEVARGELFRPGAPNEPWRFRPLPGTDALRAEAVRRRVTGERVALVLYPASGPRHPYSRRILTDRVLVRLEPGVSPDAIRSRLERRDPISRSAPSAGIETAVPTSSRSRFASAWENTVLPDAFVVTADETGGGWALAQRLREMKEVISATPLLARLRERKFVPNDPLFSQQWPLRNTGVNGAVAGIDLHITNVWDQWTGAGIRIGLVDDGLETTHPDLVSNVDSALGWDYYDGDADPNPVFFSDRHGTAVAGLASARGNNGLGISGAAPGAALAGIRLVSGEVTDEQEANAFGHRNDVIQVMNCSWGAADGLGELSGPGPLARAALAAGVATGREGRGTIYVFAAGNGRALGDDANMDGYANSIFTFAVGAVSDQGVQANYSESGACLTVVAPSSSAGRPAVPATDRTGSEGYDPGDFTLTFSGTSAATPAVAGVVALVLEARPTLGWRDVQEILMRSATPVDAGDPDWMTNRAGLHFNHKYGAGLVNAEAAVALAGPWVNRGPQTNFSVIRTNLSLPIPDNQPGGLVVHLPLTNGSLRAEHVALTVEVDHANRGDLTIDLVSPGGTVSRLLPAGGLVGADIRGWTFTSVRHWGEQARGIWTAVIADTQFLWTGTLRAIRLEVFGTIPEAVSLAVVHETNAVIVRVRGTEGRLYALEGTSDLGAWVTLGEQVCTNGAAVFTDSAGAGQRFYRARELR